jgi:hypothetical protein
MSRGGGLLKRMLPICSYGGEVFRGLRQRQEGTSIQGARAKRARWSGGGGASPQHTEARAKRPKKNAHTLIVYDDLALYATWDLAS